MADKKEYIKLWLSYETYFEAYSANEVGRLVLAMLKYRSSGVEPEFSGSERFIWPAIKRDIDEAMDAQDAAANSHREAGRSGGRPRKQNQKNQNGFSETNLAQGQGQGQGQGHGQGQGQEIAPAPARDGAVADVISDYANRVNPVASAECLAMLEEFAQNMGPEVCKKAFDIALDGKKASWPYIRAILRSWNSKGVKCLADIEALDSRKGDRYRPKPGAPPAGSAGEAELGDLEQQALQRLLQGAKSQENQEGE